MVSFLDPIDHYAGLVGKFRLLYTLQYPTEPTYEYGYSARKQVSTIGSHPVVGVFENNIRGWISKLGSHQFDSIYVIRIGYDGNQDDPAIILVLAKPGYMNMIQGRSPWGEDHVYLCGVCLKAKQSYCMRLSYTSLALIG